MKLEPRETAKTMRHIVICYTRLKFSHQNSLSGTLESSQFLKYAGTSAAVVGASALGLNILERGGAFRERGGALRVLINAGKAWVIAYHECVAATSSLPGRESLTATWGRGRRA